jgi:aspartate carbamoyltransferase catalytic subunit
MKTAQRFDSDRTALHKKLVDFLQIRQKEKIVSNLNVQMMIDIEHTATVHLKEYLKVKKAHVASILVPNLWIGRTSVSNSIDQYQVLGRNELPVVQNDVHVAEKKYSSIDNERTSLKTIIQSFDSRFDTEDIQAIRRMFAEDFGDPLPQQVFLEMMGSRRNVNYK